VQEGGNGNWLKNGWMAGIMINGSGPQAPAPPQLNDHFVKWSNLAGSGNDFRDNIAYGVVNSSDSEYYSGAMASYWGPQYFTNCLFFRVGQWFWDQHDAASFAYQNCTFYDGFLAMCRYAGQSASFWSIENTAFDGTGFLTADNFAGATNHTAFDHNAYNTNNLSWTYYPNPYPPTTGKLEVTGPTDKLLGGYNWQVGPMGSYYQPSNSPLLQAGFTNANLVGLAQFCVLTNQTEEGTNIVSIAFHYPAIQPPIIAGQPLSQTVAAGSNATFTVLVTNTLVVNYQWALNGTNIAAATASSYTVTNAQATNAGIYSAVVSNPAGSATSSGATLTVTDAPPCITSQPVSQAVLCGTNTAFSVAALGSPPLQYQWCLNGFSLSGATGATLALSSVQTNQAGIYSVIVSNAYGSAASAPASLVVVVPTTNSVGGTGSGPAAWLQGSQVFFPSSPGTLVAIVAEFGPGSLTSVTLNGLALPAATGQFTLSVPLSPGTNTFTLVASDTQTRTAQATTTVYLDSPLPTITITSPANNSSFNTSRVNVSGTFSESFLNQITVNNVLAFINGTNFCALNVPLTAGANALTATVISLAGNTNTNTITVTATPDGSGNLTDPVQLAATPTNGFAPLQVAFQAQASVPGSIQQVLWDFNGDNIPDRTAPNLQPLNYTYPSDGQYFPVVTVQTASASFSSLGGWHSYTQPLVIDVEPAPAQLGVINVADPVDVKWMAGENLYVLSASTATITEFAANGTVIRSLVGIGPTPSGLDVDTNGNVYVAITGANQVWRFNPTASSFAADPTFGSAGHIGRADGNPGSGSNEFSAPYDVAVSMDETSIYVSDSGNNRVQQFSSAGSFLSSIGAVGSGVGQFNAPKGIASAPDGTQVVVDSANYRAATLTGGGVLAVFGQQGTAAGQFQSPLNAAASVPSIYVADTGNNRIQKFDSQSFSPIWQLSTALGLSQPASVSVANDPVIERIYIADTGNNRVVGVSFPMLDPLGVWNTARQALINGDIDGALTQFSLVTVDHYRNLFLTLGTNSVSQSMAATTSLTPLELDSTAARYYFTNTIGGQQFTFVVNFAKEYGVWKIRNY